MISQDRFPGLYKKVKEIICLDWNPIGLEEDAELLISEYQSYVPKIYSTLVRDGTEDKIAAIMKRALHHMGLPYNDSEVKDIVKQLVTLKRAYDLNE